jgi:hypothetical protein
MKLNECEREASVLDALGIGSMTEELAAHVRSCVICQDAQLVWSYLEQCGREEMETELPGAGVIWWKAQLARKRAGAQRSIAWIEAMQKIALALAAIAVIAVGAWQSPRLLAASPVLLAGTAAVVVVLLTSVIVLASLDRHSQSRRFSENRLGPRGL